MLQSGPDLRAVQVVLCDLDGVVWLAHEPLPGAPEAVAALRAGGRRVLFVTNNAFSTIAEQEAALDAAGIPAAGAVINSAQAAAGLVEPGERVLVGGERGLFEALAARRAETFDPIGWNAAGRPAVAAVVMGLHRTFDYVRLDALSAAARAGARFVATNDDATYPTPQGLVPGGGSLVAAVATAAGVTPTVAGKPHPPMAAAVAARIGDGFVPERTLMVGDQWSTDGAFAVTLGCRFALVRTGVTPPGADVDGGPVAVDAPDLADLAARVVG
jgi:HAD superfamily hydrolase (TIGR01450 family)